MIRNDDIVLTKPPGFQMVERVQVVMAIAPAPRARGNVAAAVGIIKYGFRRTATATKIRASQRGVNGSSDVNALLKKISAKEELAER